MIYWKHQPIMLYPELEIEDGVDGGIWSGSAIEVNGSMAFAYTDHYRKDGQTRRMEIQKMAVSHDAIRVGENFTMVDSYPADIPQDIRDPKVWHNATENV